MDRRPEIVDLPDCWNDELTMSALFSPIRKATVNPLDKPYKMRFWKPLIEKWCIQNKCNFTLSDLRKAFERNGKTPACLEEIIHVMLREIVAIDTNATNLWFESLSELLEGYEAWNIYNADKTVIQATILNCFVKCFRVKKNKGSDVTDIDGRDDDDSTQAEDKV
uniref:Uncharacterized protein n=1 Tax=Timema cristinae TaxID=61476 RepID=A0A7R9CWM9_TIMCR|nr:unnamed protein product [Timema cristinae]